MSAARASQPDLFSDDGLATGPRAPRIYPNDLVHIPAYLDEAAQRALLAEVETVLAAAPLFQPAMPKTGRAFSVKMSNAGALGWVSDRDGGYRYQAVHPVTGEPWPAIPPLALQAWDGLADMAYAPEACLINFYDAAAKMGLHQDSDEAELGAPVVSLSLGAACIFRFGGTLRGGKTQALTLRSGDALVLKGRARLAYHGVSRILYGTSQLIEKDGRINLTLRRVTRPI